jgi:glycosyltransferase involved in cell wall biosynthesis
MNTVAEGNASQTVTPGKTNPRPSSTVRPLVILHVLAPAQVGGLEQVVHALAVGHCAAGHRVCVAAVVSQDPAEHPFIENLRAEGVDVRVAQVSPRAYARERAFIRELCRELQPDVVHTHGYRPDVVDSGVARALGIGTVSTVHGFIALTLRGRVYEWIQRRWLRRFAAVAAVSRPQVALLRKAGVSADRIQLLPNAWSEQCGRLSSGSARAQLRIPPNVFHVGWVGRLSSEKGADVLVAALSHLRDLPLVVSFIGDGPERAQLTAGAATAGETRLRWHGFIANAGRLYASFDAFVLSSRTEGTPIALLEAMAAEIPVVATAVGGVPDIVSPADALLVPPDDPAALAAAIRRVYDDRSSAAARARSASQRLQRDFAREPWLASYEALYRRVASSRVRS